MCDRRQRPGVRAPRRRGAVPRRLGGYQLEAQCAASIRRAVRASLDEVGPRDATEISRGERKQIARDMLFSSGDPVPPGDAALEALLAAGAQAR